MGLPRELDLVVVVRRGFFNHSYADLKDRFERMARQWVDHEN